MAKDNNKPNTELIKRLKTLLAESDQPQIRPEETKQEPLEEAFQDLLKKEIEVQQDPLTEGADMEVREEATPEVSISEFETQPSEPPEKTNQRTFEETPQDLEINEYDKQQNEPLEEIIQELEQESSDMSITDAGLQQNKPPQAINQETLAEIAEDTSSSISEMRQAEPSEMEEQAPEDKYIFSDQLKNTLREGVNMPQMGNYVVNYKNIIVKTSDGSVISGKTNIDAFGRLTEYLKQGTDRFITVFSEEAGEKAKQVTIVNKDHIIWANTWD